MSRVDYELLLIAVNVDLTIGSPHFGQEGGGP